MWHYLCILLFTVVSYNVENLFDNRHDSLKNDYEYTADGDRHWSYQRMENKCENIAKVICIIGEGTPPAIVGLCEVENDRCLQMLCRKMPIYPYKPIHFESEDERGVDVAILCDTTQFFPMDAAPLHVDLGEDKTRDILFVKGVELASGDTLFCFVCHLPSMLGGKAASEWKRQKAKSVIQNKIDSLLLDDSNARIVVMGDMNTGPEDDIHQMTNRMLVWANANVGSHRYNGIWTCLDQFYVSKALLNASVRIFDADFLLCEDTKFLGKKPRRTFVGFKYDRSGYSDHLPIVLSW